MSLIEKFKGGKVEAEPTKQGRVIVYIDGFNLYFGMREAKLHHCYWLDVQALGEHMLRDGQKLVAVKYFTSRIASPTDKRLRQTAYLEALSIRPLVQTIFGQYRDRQVSCDHCGKISVRPNEKMTDVNIASELLCDAHLESFDTAILVSGDSDLVGPIKAVMRLWPRKRAVCGFPPCRYGNELKKVASASFRIKERDLLRCQLPSIVTRKDGFQLARPAEWQ